jgi:hypothetical protein
MPLELEITPAALAPQHMRATIEYLVAIKLWPGFEQAERRREFLRTCAAARIVDDAKAVPGTLRVEMLDLAFDALPKSAFTADIRRRVAEGLHVGEYYATAIALDRASLPVSVKHLRKFQTRPERRRLHPSADIGESQLRDLLREYRPALHLWTANYILSVRDLQHPPDVGELLALSEWIAHRLTEIQLDRRTTPMLGPNADLWRVPPSVVRELPPAAWPDVIWPDGKPPLPSDLWELSRALSD